MAPRPERLPHDAIVDDLARAFRQSQAQIMAQIRGAVQSGNLFKANERRLQLAAVIAALDQLGAVVDPLARQAVAKAYEEGAQRAAAQIGAQVGRDPLASASFNGVRVEAIQQLQASALDRLGASRRTVGRRVEDFYAKAGRRAAVRALLGAQGSPQEAARALAGDITRDPEYKRLLRQGVSGFVDRSGRQWSLDTYSEMVVRTTTREAVVQGQVQRMADAGVNLARVSQHASSCSICRPFEGRLISLDGSLTEFQGQSVADTSIGLPPYHPNCRHTIEPVVTEFEAFRGGTGRAPTPPAPTPPRTPGRPQRTPTRRRRSSSAQGSSQPRTPAKTKVPQQPVPSRSDPAGAIPREAPRFKKGAQGKVESTQWVRDNILDYNDLEQLGRSLLDRGLEQSGGSYWGTAPMEAVQSYVDGVLDVLGGTNIRLRILEVGNPGVARAVASYTPNRGLPGAIRFRRKYMKGKRGALKDAEQEHRWFGLSKEQKLRSFDDRIEAAKRQGSQSPGAKQNIAKLEEKRARLEAAERWGMSEVAPDPVRSVASHEAGHALMRQTAGLEESWRRAIAKIPRVDWFRVSEYAGSKDSELWAEVVAAVADGNAKLVPDNILQAFRKVMKEYGYAIE